LQAPGSQLRPVTDHLDDHVADLEACRAHPARGLLQQGGAGRACPAGIVGAEQAAQIAQARSRQQGVARRVRGGVAVGVSCQAGLAWPVEAGEIHLPARRERVDVDADAHPGNYRVQLLRTSSSRASALSSLVFSASASSLTRIWRALASMRFSPADNPRSRSRRHRSRTTSATLFTSPDASFSKLAL